MNAYMNQATAPGGTSPPYRGSPIIHPKISSPSMVPFGKAASKERTSPGPYTMPVTPENGKDQRKHPTEEHNNAEEEKGKMEPENKDSGQNGLD